MPQGRKDSTMYVSEWVTGRICSCQVELNEVGLLLLLASPEGRSCWQWWHCGRTFCVGCVCTQGLQVYVGNTATATLSVVPAWQDIQVSLDLGRQHTENFVRDPSQLPHSQAAPLKARCGGGWESLSGRLGA
jgi:hypothetical protein